MRLLCDRYQDLATLLQKVTNFEGEGVIVRKVASKYENGRSESLIKVKDKVCGFNDFIIYNLLGDY